MKSEMEFNELKIKLRGTYQTKKDVTSMNLMEVEVKR